MKDFRRLNVWQKAHASALNIYRTTKCFPDDERFGLTSQLRRAAISVPSNIAEGCGRQSDRELANFLNIAAGSASEIDYQLLLAKDLDYITNDQYQLLEANINEVKRMLNSFINKINQANG